MKHLMRKFQFTLINFQGEVIGVKYRRYERAVTATARGAKLLWENDKCARVLIETEYGFLVTITWGLGGNY